MSAPRCSGFCHQGRAACSCDPYANEPAPRFVRWLDEHPRLSQVLGLAFVLLVLGVGGVIDGGVL